MACLNPDNRNLADYSSTFARQPVRSDRLVQAGEPLSCQLDEKRAETAAFYQNIVRRESGADFVIAALSIKELVPGQHESSLQKDNFQSCRPFWRSRFPRLPIIG
jgi:hypothetical protein